MAASSSSSSCFFSTLVFVSISIAEARDETMLRGGMLDWTSNEDVPALRKQMQTEVTSMFWCGKPVTDTEFVATREMLVPLWRSLPKNRFGKVDRLALRYIAHRHFSRRFNIWVRGFEPTRAANASFIDDANILDRGLPLYIEAVLKSYHGESHGFSMEDAIYMLLFLQQIIVDSEIELLEHVFAELGKSMQRLLAHGEVKDVLQSYFFHWLIGEDIHKGTHLATLHNLTHVEMTGHALNSEMQDFVDFINGQIRTMRWKRSQLPFLWDSHSLWQNQYSFTDVQKIVTEITMSFGSFYASDCRAMKRALIEMDPRGMGRVSVSRFYAATVEGRHRFAESRSYLRELGALDETSPLLGTQIIIPNYLQAASNCLVSVSHYRICCSNECEDILGNIESALGSSTASPVEILEVVMNFTSSDEYESDSDDEEPVAVGRKLMEQLQDIALVNAGQVKLHGRLFSQWLHYAFPRECPFPHKIGTISHATPREYGNVSVESWERMQDHATDPLEMFASDVVSRMDKEDLQWMSQWNSDEELILELEDNFDWSMRQRERFLLGGVLVAFFGGIANIASNYMLRCCRISSKGDHRRALRV